MPLEKQTYLVLESSLPIWEKEIDYHEDIATASGATNWIELGSTSYFFFWHTSHLEYKTCRYDIVQKWDTSSLNIPCNVYFIQLWPAVLCTWQAWSTFSCSSPLWSRTSPCCKMVRMHHKASSESICLGGKWSSPFPTWNLVIVVFLISKSRTDTSSLSGIRTLPLRVQSFSGVIVITVHGCCFFCCFFFFFFALIPYMSRRTCTWQYFTQETGVKGDLSMVRRCLLDSHWSCLQSTHQSTAVCI